MFDRHEGNFYSQDLRYYLLTKTLVKLALRLRYSYFINETDQVIKYLLQNRFAILVWLSISEPQHLEHSTGHTIA